MSFVSFFCEGVLLALIAYHFISSFLSKDKSLIWSPISIIAITYFYYCSIPFWGGTVEKYTIDEGANNGYLFHIASLLSYVCILIGFKKESQINFGKWNFYFTPENSGKYGLFLFVIGLMGYVSVRGLHLTIAADTSHDIVTGGLSYYFMSMIEIFAVSGALLLIGIRKNPRKLLYWIPFWFIMVTYVVAGARWRIVVFLIGLLASFYLYPKPRKVNVVVVGALAFVMYLGFSVMEHSRQRGVGIDMGKASELSYEEVKKGPEENMSVYWYSILSLNRLNVTGERVYFAPIITAVLMPIPRAIFPWKPDAEYAHRMERIIIGSDEGGAAYLNFVESYMAFGWFGVIFMALFLGWYARIFWDNYRRNPNSIGAILALGVFSGVCYCVVSRGFLPSTLTNVLMVIYLPFWIVGLLRKSNKKIIK